MSKCYFKNNFIKITFLIWCSAVNLLHVFRTTFPKLSLDDCFCIKSYTESSANVDSKKACLQDTAFTS